MSLGKTATIKAIVTEEMTAKSVGSGDLRVLATPVMATLVEQAACKCLEGCLQDNQTSVGTMIIVKHISPSPVGMEINITVTLDEIREKIMMFSAVISDECGQIGTCEHTRVIVDSERFMSKALTKINVASLPPQIADSEFWYAVDSLIEQSEIVIDRPKGTSHPRYDDYIYPLDYGYLNNTNSQDGGGIDVWCGSMKNNLCDAIVCTIDLIKKDSEIKLLLGCTEEEKQVIMHVHNDSDYMKGIMIKRNH
jgi:inorganic pyrophosphatase